MDQLNSCCGIGEIDGLGTPVETLVDVSDNYPDFNLVVFTDRVSFKNGSNLARYITRHKLGTIVHTKPVQNVQPGHSTSMVKLWAWTPNWKALKKWRADHNKKHFGINSLYTW